MKNTFLIVNCNDYKSTVHLISNITNYKCLDEIVIVDNGSNTKEKEKIANIKMKNVNVIYNEHNYGYSYAINIGTRYLIKKYGKCNIFVSNSDVVIMSENDLIRMIDVFKGKNIGLVGPQVLELGGIHRGVKDVKPWIEFLLTVPFVRNLISDDLYLYKDEYYQSGISKVEVISSCFFLTTSQVLEKINFMDESVFLYYEDYIISKKIRNVGLDIVVLNSVKIKHLYSVSVDAVINNINKYKMLKKSQIYYHTTYNDANWIERILLKVNAYLGVLVRKIKSLIFK